MHPKNLNFLQTHRWPLSPRSGCLTSGMLNPNILNALYLTLPPTKTDHKALFKGAAAGVVIFQNLLQRESPKPLHSLAFMIGEAGAPTYAVPAGPPVPDPALPRCGGYMNIWGGYPPTMENQMRPGDSAARTFQCREAWFKYEKSSGAGSSPNRCSPRRNTTLEGLAVFGFLLQLPAFCLPGKKALGIWSY